MDSKYIIAQIKTNLLILFLLLASSSLQAQPYLAVLSKPGKGGD